MGELNGLSADEWRDRERTVGLSTTEEVWAACPAADFLFFHIENARLEGRRALNERKLRLFGCACCRLLWPNLTHPSSRAAVEAAERYADGANTEDELIAAGEAAEGILPKGRIVVPHAEDPRRAEYLRLAPAWAAGSVVRSEGDGWPYSTHVNDIIEKVMEATEYEPFTLNREVTEAALCAFLRDIFGNPFRPAVFSPSWRTDTAVALARTMYDSRDFSAMPILADALQDAGCGNTDVLNHCRDANQVHVKGCWVVDLVLGKE